MKNKKYICNTTCWVGGLKKAMFVPGDIVGFTEDETIPGHFTCIEPEEVIMKEEVKPEKPKEEVKELVIESPVMVLEDNKEEEIKPKNFRRPTLSKE
jgi:hypothetical protein